MSDSEAGMNAEQQEQEKVLKEKTDQSRPNLRDQEGKAQDSAV
jgi:hypothetical protein